MMYGFLSVATCLVAGLAQGVAALNYNVSLNSQVRSAYHGSNGMTVSWNTFTQLSNPTVRYGLSPNNLNMVASSSISVTYDTSLTYNNHVLLSNLYPNTQYYYLPTQLINKTFTPYTFLTSRPLGDPSPYTAAVVVDMGAMGSEGLTTSAGKGIPSQEILMPGEQNTIQSLASQVSTYDFLLHPGDLAYADTWLTEVNQGFLQANTSYSQAYKAYESILDDFYDDMITVTGYKAYMVGPGNHEANCLNKANGTALCMMGQNNFTGYRNHFRMPSDVATQASNNLGTGNMWYSFDHGLAHYVVLDTETDFPGAPDIGYPAGPFGAPGAQQAWLQADLAAVNRSVTPWIIVGLHRPWYTSGENCTVCQAAFEPLLNQYSVDLVITGHYHVYERNTPVLPGAIPDPAGLNNPTAPWYITNGVGGHYGGLSPFNNQTIIQRYGLSILNATYGWSKLTFNNCTHLTHEFVNASSNAVLDTATLYKNRTCSLTNNYNLPGYAAPTSLPGAISAPSSYLTYARYSDYFNPSKCGQRCDTINGCTFFVVYKEYQNGADTGTTCAFYSQSWDASYATNQGQYRGSTRITIQNAYSYSKA